VLVNEIGERHEFVFAEFPVAVLIELGEQFFRLRHLWRRTAWPRAAIGATACFAAAAFTGPRFAFAALAFAAFFVTLQPAHFFAGFRALIVAELAVLVGVELFEHLLTHLGAAFAIAFFGVFVGRVGERCHRHETCRQEYKA
jgi:hypothetical protein